MNIQDLRILFEKALNDYTNTRLSAIQVFDVHLHAPLEKLFNVAVGGAVCDDCAEAEEIRGGSGGQSTFAETTPESFDGSKVDPLMHDEFGQTGKLVFKATQSTHIRAFQAKMIADQYPLEDIVSEIMKVIKSAAHMGHHRISFNVNKVPSRRRDEVWKYLFDLGYKIEPNDDTLNYIFISW